MADLDPDDAEAAAIDAGLEKRLSKIDVQTRRKIEDWAKKLVDLSKRNRLLHYRATKRTTLTFRHPNPDTILARVVDGGSYTFYRPPELPPFVPGRQRDVTPLDDEIARHRPLERELVTIQRDLVEIARSLDAIDRKAKAEYEDRGTHVLYLAWGLLRWVDPKSQEEQQAPIVLVPLELSRGSVTQPYTLRAAADADAIVNPALRVKLEVDFNLALPDIDVDETPPARIAELIGGAVPRAWLLESHAAIGIFGFAKEAMYRDLVDHAAEVAKHPVIKSMVRGELTADLAKALNVALPTESELDESSDPGFSVVDADSSQRRAIEAANRGLSFVLHGPPGTGKSQTITNIIAEFIGRGKSVLFVSQKMAALEVVAKRLDETELRDLVLELPNRRRGLVDAG